MDLFKTLGDITKPEPVINAIHFIAKQDSINKAIERVKIKLKYFEEQAAKIPGNWTDADRERLKDWNKLHDLEHRLENRLRENWRAYHDWHWDAFGWNAY